MNLRRALSLSILLTLVVLLVSPPAGAARMGRDDQSPQLTERSATPGIYMARVSKLLTQLRSQAARQTKVGGDCGYSQTNYPDGSICVSSWCGSGCSALDCVWAGGGEYHYISGCGVN